MSSHTQKNQHSIWHTGKERANRFLKNNTNNHIIHLLDIFTKYVEIYYILFNCKYIHGYTVLNIQMVWNNVLDFVTHYYNNISSVYPSLPFKISFSTVPCCEKVERHSQRYQHIASIMKVHRHTHQHLQHISTNHKKGLNAELNN